jgi:hypothetical protein
MGIIEITNEGLGFKLTNFMSFGEFVISVGYIQKTIKEGLFVKGNFGIPPRHQHGKDLAGTRRQTPKAWAKWPQKWANRPKP